MQLPARRSFSLLPQIASLTLTRIVLNTSFRMVYPLLPVFSRSVQVDVATIANLLTVLQLAGLTAPLFGQVAEQRGRRFVILLGILTFTLGMFPVFLLPNFWGFAASLLLASIGKLAFDPAVQAYIGDRVPYERRGLALGVMELGWSGAFLLGVPAMTWLIAQFDWKAPFVALLMLGAAALVVNFWLLSSDRPEAGRKSVSLIRALQASVNTRMAVAGLVLGFGISAANQLVSVVFGSWIEASFGVLLGALAAASVAIGLSELLGEGIVLGLADRFGKRRLVILGIVGNIFACFLLPFTSVSLAFALFGLFFFYLTFETALVATIPLATELSPETRAMYMTVMVAAFTLGRAVITPFAPLLFRGGLWANVALALLLNGIALLAVWRFIRVK